MSRLVRTIAAAAIAVTVVPIASLTPASATVRPAAATAASCNAEVRGACATVAGITSAGDAGVGRTLTCSYHLASSYSLYGLPGNVLYTWKRSFPDGRYQIWDKGRTLSVSADMVGWNMACFVTVPTGVNQVMKQAMFQPTISALTWPAS